MSESAKQIRQVTVTNNGKFTAEIAVSGKDYGIGLGNIEADAKNVVFDLSGQVYVRDGSPFQVRVWISPYANDTNDTWVVYEKNSEVEAVYDVDGTADKPTISFKGLRPIPGPMVSE
ncbi:hypothetical protein BDP27DRAFT_1417950 [Rhodocollybia butyracea]|uniref:Uncharacterized protein n=1 Tax=Rhodocollybia butyracea TaxID=206335 RepID=A0A9P5UB13_9AGAR|nr:hypothetical protein BDP27DRAFT_1417950 [Rhodocollybia butyracea]